MPNPSTLMNITKRCGPETIDQLNETLLAKAREAKVVRLDKVRADTTAVEANVAYPTDSGLLARGVARMASLTKKLKGMGLARRTRAVNNLAVQSLVAAFADNKAIVDESASRAALTEVTAE